MYRHWYTSVYIVVFFWINRPCPRQFTDTCTRVLSDKGSLLFGAAATGRTFELCDATSLEGDSARVMFAGDGVVMLPIQGNDPACDGTLCNIKAVCGVMTDDDRGSEASKPANL